MPCDSASLEPRSLRILHKLTAMLLRLDAGEAVWPKGWRRLSPHWDEDTASHGRAPQVLRKVCNPCSPPPGDICPVSCLTQILPAVHNSAQLACFIFLLGWCLKCYSSAGKLVTPLGVPVVCVQPIQQGWLQELNCWNARKVLRNLKQKLSEWYFHYKNVLQQVSILSSLWEKLGLWGSAASLQLPPAYRWRSPPSTSHHMCSCFSSKLSN